ncbi:MAG TPA: cupin domain-containing protein [Pilimelia sp.]|nr:cupin domain-containing protein [Pilimelia sp.]
MPVIRRTDNRRTETAGAVMTTLASPTLGGAALAVWRVDMQPGHAGPLHAIDAEQVWTVIAGAAALDLDGETTIVAAGDTVVLPPDVPRRLRAEATGFAALVSAPATMRAYRLDTGAAAKLTPPWVR